MFQWKTPVLTACVVGLLAATSSAAYADKDYRGVVRSSSGKVVTDSYGNCVRTGWPTEGDACAPDQAVAQAAAPRTVSPARRIQQEERTLYFEFNKYRLTEDSKRKLDSIANILRSDNEVKNASIVGYADRIGTTAYNEQLSKRRAKAVQDYLTSRGYLNTSVAQTRWLGEAYPKTNCSDKLKRPELIACLQPDRRVELEIEFQPEPATAQQPAAQPAPVNR